jgi:hypothetical protein
MTTRSLRPSPPLITVERVVAAFVLVLVGFGLLASVAFFGATWLYFVYLLVTVFVVRSVAVEPGKWLGLRAVRRGLVLLTTLVTLDFLAMSLTDFRTFGLALLVLLALCDLALGRATRRIATAEPGHLDERQESLRNRAHRIAYAILALSVGLVVVVAEVVSPSTRRWLSDAIGGGTIVTFVQLLFFLPAMVIAWIEPDRIADEDASIMGKNTWARVAYAMVATAVVLPIVLALSLAVAPVRMSAFTKSQPPFTGQGNQAATGCEYFDAREQVGIGFGATIPLAAVACWNGTMAFESWGLSSSDCHPGRTELVTDTTVQCTRVTGADGSLHFTYRTSLRSPILPFVSRDVAVTLDLTKEGKVVQFP